MTTSTSNLAPGEWNERAFPLISLSGIHTTYDIGRYRLKFRASQLSEHSFREHHRGGILSPLVWNLAFNELLDDFTSGPAQMEGFADDTAILLRGPDIHTLIEQGQEAVNRALLFGTANSLEFGTEKTEAVIFTHKRIKTSDLPHLQTGNSVLKYSKSVKYLGIILDSKLSFGPHIRDKAKKVTRLLYRIRSSVGQLWGPNPYLV